jgi:hypothetical protein
MTMRPDIHEIPLWLRNLDDDPRTQRIWELGLLTGWRRYADGRFGAPNFERALVLDRLMELLKPESILEIGTGRGLGCLTMATAAELYGFPTRITTVDMLAPETAQPWPIRLEGEDRDRPASRDEIWGEHVSAGVREKVVQVTGTSKSVLPDLYRQGARFDLVFIDGGHDVASVMHDLMYATCLLKRDGTVLMDDFTPLHDYGWGACLAYSAAREHFETAIVFPTEGVVYGNSGDPEYPRGMVILAASLGGSPRPAPSRLLYWRLLGRLLGLHRRARVFPLA